MEHYSAHKCPRTLPKENKTSWSEARWISRVSFWSNHASSADLYTNS